MMLSDEVSSEYYHTSCVNREPYNIFTGYGGKPCFSGDYIQLISLGQECHP